MTTLIISNYEIEDIIKIVKYLEDSGLLLKGVTETVQNEVKEQKWGLLSMLLGILGASLLGNPLTGKGTNRTGEGIVRAGCGNKFWNIEILILLILKYKNIIRMSLDLMVFVLEIIYLK